MSDNPFQSPTTIVESMHDAPRYPLSIRVAQILGVMLASFQISEGLFSYVESVPLYSLLPWIGMGTLLAVMLMTVPHHFAQFCSQAYFGMMVCGAVLMIIGMSLLEEIDFYVYSTPATLVVGVVVPILLFRKSAEGYYHDLAKR
ncbi:hypothetical protein [Blastopirellula marina]|uniref:Uncharacterized protein n=1 Tax=Blastopirellula marina TaxID=124 RepID=A0A2S8GQD0_9BACT|nr:hypothetical protein [Blastopirellula marina]PQO46224.1 hypothetical protein C5Y93_09565 [Blastopirellula marina]